MKNVQTRDINNPKEIFGQGLFWDAGEIDIKRHADYILAGYLCVFMRAYCNRVYKNVNEYHYGACLPCGTRGLFH